MSSQYGELRPTNGWDQWTSLGTPANLNGFRVVASLLHRRRSTDVNHTLHDVWPSPMLALALTQFCQVQSLLCVQVLRYHSIGSVTARHLSTVRQPNLRRGTRNGIKKLSQRAPPVFGRAAVRLGIGPHSSLLPAF